MFGGEVTLEETWGRYLTQILLEILFQMHRKSNIRLPVSWVNGNILAGNQLTLGVYLKMDGKQHL